MKETYDVGAVFSVRFYTKNHKLIKTINFDEIDGLPIGYIMDEINASHYDLIVRHPIYKHFTTDGLIAEERVLISDIARPIYELTAEKAIESCITDNYNCMDELKKCMACCFLERYVASYAKVRNFKEKKYQKI